MDDNDIADRLRGLIDIGPIPDPGELRFHVDRRRNRRGRGRAAALVGVAVVSAVTAMVAVGVGRSDQPRQVVAAGGDETETSEPGGGSSVPSAPADDRNGSVIFAGLPIGVSDSFEMIPDAAELRDRTATTLTGAFVGYERITSDDLQGYGYSGPSGVLRLYFKVEHVLGGRAAPREAPGREGTGVIAVDYDYWVAPSMIDAHAEALAGAEDTRYLLFLVGGTLNGNTSTGAYRLWEAPLGAVQVGQELTQISPTIDYVAAEAVERGEKFDDPHTSATEPTEEGEPSGIIGDAGDAQTVLTPLYGRSATEVVAELTAPGTSQHVSPPGEIPLG